MANQSNKQKIAVVLFNLGGPDNIQAVQPFLFRLFNDRAIINLPQPFRYLIAQLITYARLKKATQNYAMLGGKSPIIQETMKQAIALERRLNVMHSIRNYKTFFFMRYWHPMAESIMQDILQFNPEKILLLPLYPQFSTTTTGSSLAYWHEVATKYGISAQHICCYPLQDGFTTAYADLILTQYKKALLIAKPRILFSAHGLPLSIVEDGDPYALQVKQSVEAVITKMNIPQLDFVICYQSKVGRKKWLEPSVQHELKRAAADGRSVVIVPITFVSEHSETLIELDVEYKTLADKYNISGYFRVPSVGTDHAFIDGLAKLCIEEQDNYNEGCAIGKVSSTKKVYLNFCKKYCNR